LVSELCHIVEAELAASIVRGVYMRYALVMLPVAFGNVDKKLYEDAQSFCTHALFSI